MPSSTHRPRITGQRPPPPKVPVPDPAPLPTFAAEVAAVRAAVYGDAALSVTQLRALNSLVATYQRRAQGQGVALVDIAKRFRAHRDATQLPRGIGALDDFVRHALAVTATHLPPAMPLILDDDEEARLTPAVPAPPAATPSGTVTIVPVSRRLFSMSDFDAVLYAGTQAIAREAGVPGLIAPWDARSHFLAGELPLNPFAPEDRPVQLFSEIAGDAPAQLGEKDDTDGY